MKRPVLDIIRPLRPPHRIYRHLHFTGEFDVQTPVRPFRIRHYGYEIENELFWEGLPGRRERVSTELWMQLCRRAAVVFDVGANTGVYSLIASAMNPAAKVFAFEPVRRVFDKLRHNCALNGFEIEAMPIALSNREGNATLYDFEAEHVYAASLNPTIYAQSARRSVEVPVSTLATIIRSHALDRVDLVKLDVEGHEPEVLEGMGSYLAELRPTLLIEILTGEVGQRVEALTGDLRYLFFDIDEAGAARRVPHVVPGSRWNYLICQPSVARDLKLG